jgi:hypothetical protein
MTAHLGLLPLGIQAADVLCLGEEMTSMTREELLTNRLNDTGFPFKDLCTDLAARQKGWQVAAEVAYTYPPL